MLNLEDKQANHTNETAESELLKQPVLEFLDKDKSTMFHLCWSMFVDFRLHSLFQINDNLFFPMLYEA